MFSYLKKIGHPFRIVPRVFPNLTKYDCATSPGVFKLGFNILIPTKIGVLSI